MEIELINRYWSSPCSSGSRGFTPGPGLLFMARGPAINRSAYSRAADWGAHLIWGRPFFGVRSAN